jgi:hypothetical protein
MSVDRGFEECDEYFASKNEKVRAKLLGSEFETTECEEFSCEEPETFECELVEEEFE